jgi:hypothetical protein
MGFLDKSGCFFQPVAGKNSYFKLVQNGLAEKLRSMLKNRHLAIAFLSVYFEKNWWFDGFWDHQNRKTTSYSTKTGLH